MPQREVPNIPYQCLVVFARARHSREWLKSSTQGELRSAHSALRRSFSRAAFAIFPFFCGLTLVAGALGFG